MSERSPSAAKERAEALQRFADAATKCANELALLYPRTRWQRCRDRFAYRAEIIHMHLRGDFRGR